MIVRWVPDPVRSTGTGNSFGYRVMNRAFHAACVAAGITIQDDAPTAVHVVPVPKYERGPEAFSIVCTMWESDRSFPQHFRPHIHEADLVVVPSTWNVDIFRPYVRCPIVVVPLGIDPDMFRPCRRVWQPGEPFQWLWIGAPNARKGIDVIEEAWRLGGLGRADRVLYLKTSGPQAAAAMRARPSHRWEEACPGVLTYGNVILDMRTLPTEMLVQLYHQSHGFLFPTAGEGFGLTLAEALATGLPAVCTDYGGHRDFVGRDEAVWLPWRYLAAGIEDEVGNVEEERIEGAWVEPGDLLVGMTLIERQYHRALKAARRASRRLRAEYTWARAGRRFVRALRQHSREVATSAVY